MKKILGVMAILLTLALFLVYRHLVSAHAGVHRQKPSIPAAFEESLFLGSLLIQ